MQGTWLDKWDTHWMFRSKRQGIMSLRGSVTGSPWASVPIAISCSTYRVCVYEEGLRLLLVTHKSNNTTKATIHCIHVPCTSCWCHYGTFAGNYPPYECVENTDRREIGKVYMYTDVQWREYLGNVIVMMVMQSWNCRTLKNAWQSCFLHFFETNSFTRYVVHSRHSVLFGIVGLAWCGGPGPWWKSVYWANRHTQM